MEIHPVHAGKAKPQVKMETEGVDSNLILPEEEIRCIVDDNLGIILLISS